MQPTGVEVDGVPPETDQFRHPEPVPIGEQNHGGVPVAITGRSTLRDAAEIERWMERVLPVVASIASRFRNERYLRGAIARPPARAEKAIECPGKAFTVFHALMTMCQFSFCILPYSSGVMIPKTFLKLCPLSYTRWSRSIARFMTTRAQCGTVVAAKS